jgi:ABC-type glycerol-3-phosphate transport system permease component
MEADHKRRGRGKESRVRWGRLARGIPERVGLTLLILVGLVITLIPFVISAYLALTEASLPIQPYRFAPSEWTLENFRGAWNNLHVAQYGLNSFIYAGVVAVLVTFQACLTGYIFARLRFPGKEFLWYLVLASMMIPAVVTAVPLLWQMIRFPLAGGNNLLGQGGRGFYDSWPGLILPGLFGSGETFLARQFFLSLPPDLEDAARVDGCGEFGIFVRVMAPLAVPAAVTVFMFEFQGRWNSLMWPLMITSSDKHKVLAATFAEMTALVWGTHPGANPINWAQAGAIMMALPVIVAFIVGQRYFRSGIALTGLK